METLRLRGGVEFGLIALACMLVAAAVLGSGIAQSDLKIPDPLTWLSNKDGHVTRVNPETGRPVDRLLVAQPGDDLRVVQGDGVLTVTNLRTNEVTVVDLSMLTFSGTRRGNPGVEVLLNRGRIFLADKQTGHLERLDTLTAEPLGQPLRLGRALADVAVDQSGAIWLLDEAGQLVETEYSDAEARFDERGRRTVPGGQQAVLVAHERGVTVLDPMSGAVTQTGTGDDKAAQAPPLGPLVAAEASPANLVPATAPNASAVVIVHEGDVSTVDSKAEGCPRLGKPAVYRDLVYVPCLAGARKVLVLDPEGKPAGPPITTPAGGDPELVLNAGLLIINVPGGDFGLVVKPNGAVSEIRTRDPQVPAIDPTKRPPVAPKPTANRRSTVVTAPTTGTTTGSPTRSPTRTVAPTTTRPSPSATTSAPPRPEELTPTEVRAEARGDSTILISWKPPTIRPTGYRILHADTRAQLATADGAATSAIVMGLPLGQSVSFRVEALQNSGGYPSEPSNAVSAYGRPGAPVITSAQIPSRLPHAFTLQVNLDVTSDGGSQVTAFDLVVSDGRGVRAQALRVPIAQRPYSLTVACADPADLCLTGGGISITATLHNAAGSGPGGTANATIPSPVPFNYNSNANVLVVSTGLKCWSFNFTLQTCNPNDTGQRWVPHNRGWIQTAVNGQCITTAGGGMLRFTASGCDERPRRWTLHGRGANTYVLQNQEGDIGKPCIYAMGDPAADGTPIRVRACSFGANELWNFFAPFQSVNLTLSATTSIAPVNTSTLDGGPARSFAVVMLVPLAAGVARWRWRRKHGARHVK